MRRHLRHPVDMPIQLSARGQQPQLLVRNYSRSGLCGSCQRPLAPGTTVEIDMPDVEPPSYHGQGVVMWCQCVANHYEVGIEFENTAEAFAIRMAEQIYQIALYRRRALAEEGRLLNDEEAAREWVDLHARSFPRN